LIVSYIAARPRLYFNRLKASATIQAAELYIVSMENIKNIKYNEAGSGKFGQQDKH
jgi:hypothetical protein